MYLDARSQLPSMEALLSSSYRTSLLVTRPSVRSVRRFRIDTQLARMVTSNSVAIGRNCPRISRLRYRMGKRLNVHPANDMLVLDFTLTSTVDETFSIDTGVAPAMLQLFVDINQGDK